MEFQTVLYYLGYCAALFLYKDMGRIFFIPMLLNLWFNLFITFKIYQQVDFRWLIAIHGVLWLIWVFFIASDDRRKFDTVLAILLILGAFLVGTLPYLTQKPDAFKAMIELSTRIWTVWYFTAFLVVLTVIVRSTIVPKFQKRFIDILTNPRKRFLIPIGLCSGIIGITPFLEGTIPQEFVHYRFNIGSHFMVWGWIALETPFYIMYERLRRQH